MKPRTSLATFRRQVANAHAEVRRLRVVIADLKTENANLRLVSPIGDRITSLLTPPERAAWEAWTAVQQYVRACGGVPQQPQIRKEGDGK